MTYVAQWQAWLRHSREEAPSIDELLEDEERKERIKTLAKTADERWSLQGQQSVERLAVGSSDEALKGNTINSCVDPAIQEQNPEEINIAGEDPAGIKRNLPGTDPGSTFQPKEWSGKSVNGVRIHLIYNYHCICMHTILSIL